jgi:signal transduction histidine kinase
MPFWQGTVFLCGSGENDMGEGFEEITWFGNASNEQIRRSVKALYRVHRLLSVITDLDQLLLQIIVESRQVAEAEAASLMLYDPQTEELYFQVAIGETGDQEALKRTIRLKLGQGIAGVTAATRTSIIVQDAQQDPRFFADADAAAHFQTRNLLAVPLADRDELLGVIEVVNKSDGGPFTKLDLQVMEMFSTLASAAVTNARLIEEKIRNERLAAIGQAVTSLSHHTKNIVTGLSSSAELIDMGLEKGNLEVLKRGWPIFKRSTKRISNFVQDMLSFSKPRKPMRECCDPGALLEEARETFAELFFQRQVEMIVDASEAEGSVWVDSQAIFRCLLNLLTNAGDAAPEEGGCIRMTARTLPDGVFEIVVADNGPGVPEHERRRIFDPFYSTKGSKGTGLGLAVTEKIVHEHEGSIVVEDSPEGGALFRILLPAWAQTGEELMAE